MIAVLGGPLCLAFVVFSRGLAVWCRCSEQFWIHVKVQTVTLSRAASSGLAVEKQHCTLETERV